MSVSMEFESEFLKFEPTPKGHAKYKGFEEGFFLYGPPKELTSSQGSGSGGSITELQFTVKATRKQFAEIGDLAINNSKKTQKITHTSCHKIEGEYQETARNVYEQITFLKTDGEHVGGERYQPLFVRVKFVKKDSKLSDYGDDGRATPSYRSQVDFEKGTVKSG